MTKISLITACALALSGSAALAQTNWIPPGPNTGPNSVTGAAPTRDVGNNVYSPQAQREFNSEQATASNEMTPGSNGRIRHRVAITDEYGFHYDSRGDRLDAQGYVISPYTR